MSIVEQELCFFIEETPTIPFTIELCPGIDESVDLTGATYVHEVKSSDLSTVLFTGTVTATPTSLPTLAEGTIAITAADLAAAGAGRHKHKMKVTTSGGVTYVVIPPSDFIIQAC